MIFTGVALVYFVPSVTLPNAIENLRSLPFSKLEECAKKAAEEHAHGTKVQKPASDCFEGRLLPAGPAPATDVQGRALTREEIALVQKAQGRNETAFLGLPDRTVIALRSNPAAANSSMFLATVPLRHGRFAIWSFRRLSRPIFLSGLISFLLAAYFVRPITRLSEVADQFGSGDLKVRVAGRLAKRRDELGDLGRGFNQMASRIEILVTRQRSFLAHASHELGSPLTRLNIALALAKRKAGVSLVPELNRIEQEANRLNGLVQELLLLARLESGNELDRNPAVFDVLALVEEAKDNAEFEAKQIGKSVISLRADSFHVAGYPDLLLRALDNVLRNGLRFARANGEVQIDCYPKPDGSAGVIHIQDDGPGIPLGTEESIFEPFVTLSPSGTDPALNGSGLGLAITRQAVLSNGGTVKALSVLGTGLTVVIELPLHPS